VNRSVCVLTLALWTGACSDASPPSAEVAVAPESLHVGLIPYTPDNPYASYSSEHVCLPGPNRQAVSFRMHDEEDSDCSHWTGWWWEPDWAPPQALKYWGSDTCAVRKPDAAPSDFTALHFCRTAVPADTFRPLTTDPAAVHEFYALLKFGDECPPNSIEIQKKIINEDQNNQNSYLGTLDTLAPNEITNDALGNFTRLFFCYFRAAPTEAETMESFPDVGFSYAVFHDYEGKQPGWVVAKRFVYSDDSNYHTRNEYFPDPADHPEVVEFQALVENPRPMLPDGAGGPARDTCFDWARVR
jgi:hypothetical protein